MMDTLIYRIVTFANNFPRFFCLHRYAQPPSQSLKTRSRQLVWSDDWSSPKVSAQTWLRIHCCG